MRDSFAIYEVVAGDQAGTLYQFRPVRSADDLDERIPGAREILGEAHKAYADTIVAAVPEYSENIWGVVAGK